MPTLSPRAMTALRVLALALFAALILNLFGPHAKAQEAVAGRPFTVTDRLPLQSGRFTVEVVGQGSDVILIPGLASSRESWRATVAANKTRRFHLIQVAGFAGAPTGANLTGDAVAAPTADAIADYIKDRRLQAPAVIGHSLGGEVALMLASRHPKAVGKVMVVDSLPFMAAMFGPGLTVEAVRPQAAMMRAGLLETSDEAWAAQSAQTIAGLVKTPERRAGPLADTINSHRAVVAAAMFELMTTDLRRELAAISVPVTVVYAAHAQMPVSGEQLDAFEKGEYAGLKAGSFVRIDDSGHFVMLDQPEAFQKAVTDFLAQ